MKLPDLQKMAAIFSIKSKIYLFKELFRSASNYSGLDLMEYRPGVIAINGFSIFSLHVIMLKLPCQIIVFS